MEYTLRFFLDGAECTDKEHTFKYTHAARMLVPRIGEHVWIDDNTCVEVDMVTYSPDCYDGDNLYMVDIECHDVTEDVLAEIEEEDF